VAELLPGPRSEREPEGDGPNSPWFDWRRARGTGAAEPGSASEDADGDGDEDEPWPEDAADAASVAPRMFPWFSSPGPAEPWLQS
jgi:hypothetical protein